MTERMQQDSAVLSQQARSWSVKPFRYPGSLDLSGPATFWVSPQLMLQAYYNPPGSRWIALGATILSWLFVVIVSQAIGFAAAPGWLIWLLLIRRWRRRFERLFLDYSEKVIIDNRSRRMAFLSQFRGKKRWVAFGFNKDFEEAAQLVRTIAADKCQDSKIRYFMSPLLFFLICLLTVLLLVFLLSIVL